MGWIKKRPEKIQRALDRGAEVAWAAGRDERAKKIAALEDAAREDRRFNALISAQIEEQAFAAYSHQPGPFDLSYYPPK